MIRQRIRDGRRTWHERSKLQRIDLYSRVTVGAMPWIFQLSWGLVPLQVDLRRTPLPMTLGVVLTLIGVAQCVLSSRNTRPAYQHYFGKAEFPSRGLLLPVTLLAVSLALLTALTAVDGIDDDGLVLLAMNMPVAFVTPYVLLVPVRSFMVRCLAYLAVSVGLCAAAGARGGELIGLIAAAFGCFMVLVSVRPSAWSLHVMWQAEEARDLQARLAVAEERLRFGRDMHDVLGRNLAVIALKSELAVELAQRGKPTAVDQMVEVQRIARASQQEVRDVVRGYREADLRKELMGAQGVLQAAGITCAIEDSAPDGGEPLPAPVQSALGWVVREAATNLLRHGDPRQCTIRLGTAGSSILLEVENDGAPDTTGAAVGVTGNGSGLPGLRERLAALDGSLEAGPTGDGLFLLRATVPLPRPDHRAARRPALVEER